MSWPIARAHSWFPAWCLSLAASILFPRFAPADGEPAAWRGPTLLPIHSDSIRMVRERVVIDLSPIIALVDATFVFENQGDDRQQIVAFPDIGWSGASLRNFRTWVDEAEVEVSFQKGGSYNGLHFWTVDFPAGSCRAVRVRYQSKRDPVQISTYMMADSFIYVLRTGARWKGTIGAAEIVLNLSDMHHDQITHIHPEAYQRTATGYRWALRDVEPTGDIYVGFHRTPVELVCRHASGNEMDYAGYPPLVRADTVLISSRILSKAGRFDSEWNNRTKTFTARRGPLVVRCQAGSREAFLGERKIHLRAAPDIRDGQIMIPIDLAEPLGIDAEHDPDEKKLVLRQNYLNWLPSFAPECGAERHLAPRRYLRAEYEADRRALEEELEDSSDTARAGVLFKLADIAYYCGQWEEAEQRYQQVADLQPENVWAKWWRAKCFQHQQEHELALELFLTGVEKYQGAAPLPDDYVVRSAIDAARCLNCKPAIRVHRGDLTRRALALARRGLRLCSGTLLQRLRSQVIPVLGTAKLYQDIRAIADSMLREGCPQGLHYDAVYRQLARRPTWMTGESKDAARKLAVRLRGTAAEEEFLGGMAQAELRDDNPPAAIAIYRQLLARFPESGRLWQYLEEVERVYRELGDIEAYKENCWDLITAYPAAATGCARSFSRYADEQQLRWMVENMPKPPESAVTLFAHRDYVRGDYASALRHYWAYGIQRYRLYPEDARRILMRALCELHLGDMEGAAQDLDIIEKWIPNCVEGIRAEGPESEAAYVAIARFCTRYPAAACETERAILERGLAKYPNTAELHHAVGVILQVDASEKIRASQPDREILVGAIEAYQAALELDPELRECRRDLSKAYCNLADSEEDPEAKQHYYQEALKHWDLIPAPKPEPPDFIGSARQYLQAFPQ